MKMMRWVGVMMLGAVSCVAQVADHAAVEKRVDAMLAKLSLEEKISLIDGHESWYIGPLPSIGLPKLTMSDGPMSVKILGTASVFPNGVNLAASWDPALAKRVGVAMGEEARAEGVHFLLAPGMNIYRAPQNGRNFEYLGEDPLLAGRMAVGMIQGVQSQGVSATAKHFAANNSEYDRHGSSSDVDERTLRELYLPAFEMSVKDGHVGAIMDSYNLINGVHATQNGVLNCQIAKGEWKFDGVMMSDWDATYDGVAAANNCLDVEMPSGKFMNAKTLLPAIKDGRVKEATIDDKVRRILRKAVEFGWFERDQRDLSQPIFSPAHAVIAREEAEEGMVLLKNEGHLLPLDAKKVKTIAVLGPNATPAVETGGGSASAHSFAPVSLLAGVSKLVGPETKVLYEPRALASLNTLFEWTSFTSDGKNGLKREEFANETFDGKAKVSVVQHLSHWPGRGWAEGSEKRRSVRYTGEYLPKKTGKYLVMAAANGKDRYKLFVDGKEVTSQEEAEGQVPHSVVMDFTAGKPVAVRFDVVPFTDEEWLGLVIVPTEDLMSPESLKVAAMADVVVLSVGFDTATEGEGKDRKFALPFGQDALIAAVVAANPKTVVVLNSGGAVDMAAWKDKVPALLEAWYPGEEGGRAVANVLFGVRAPEGKLPFSWEAKWEDNPVHDNYYPNTKEPRHIEYREGMNVGYRYYSSSAVKPLFPFGYGLSYTEFSFSHLNVTPAKPKRGDVVTVSFDVTNTGRHAGAEVAQLYVGDASAAVKRPERELKGFEKVRLAAGEKKHVSLTLDSRAMSYWDVATHGWKADPGAFTVMVGDSSEHTPLTGMFELQP